MNKRMSACTYSYSTRDDIHEYCFHQGDRKALDAWRRLLTASARARRRPLRILIDVNGHTDIISDLLNRLMLWLRESALEAPIFVAMLCTPQIAPESWHPPGMEQVCFFSNSRYNEALQWLRDADDEPMETQTSYRGTTYPTSSGANRAYADVR